LRPRVERLRRLRVKVLLRLPLPILKNSSYLTHRFSKK